MGEARRRRDTAQTEAVAQALRSVPEWVGANPDVEVPPRVRVRVFERYGGICQVAKRKIRAGEPWQCDHIIALCNGGQHRELNLQPVLADAHRGKTADDVGIKSKIARVRAKHLGIHPKSKHRLQGRPFPPSRQPMERR